MKTCDTCVYRDEEENCMCPKIHEPHTEREDDHMEYSYYEGGRFWVGPKFGCVHHKERP